MKADSWQKINYGLNNLVAAPFIPQVAGFMVREDTQAKACGYR